jgi:hypothetical protein
MERCVCGGGLELIVSLSVAAVDDADRLAAAADRLAAAAVDEQGLVDCKGSKDDCQASSVKRQAR